MIVAFRSAKGDYGVSEMNSTWPEIQAALLPESGLSVLAGLRCQPGAVVLPATRDWIWLRFPRGSQEITAALHPVTGVRFFAERTGEWYPLGSPVPSEERPPSGAGISLERILKPIGPERIESNALTSNKLMLSLVPSTAVRKATALLCSLEELQSWIESATAVEIGSLQGARTDREILIRGPRLPAARSGTRFHGQRFLAPLGYRPDPDWPEDWLCNVCGATENELVLFREGNIEMIPLSVFQSLSRGSLRLAASREK